MKHITEGRNPFHTVMSHWGVSEDAAWKHALQQYDSRRYGSRHQEQKSTAQSAQQERMQDGSSSRNFSGIRTVTSVGKNAGYAALRLASLRRFRMIKEDSAWSRFQNPLLICWHIRFGNWIWITFRIFGCIQKSVSVCIVRNQFVNSINMSQLISDVCLCHSCHKIKKVSSLIKMQIKSSLKTGP